MRGTYQGTQPIECKTTSADPIQPQSNQTSHLSPRQLLNQKSGSPASDSPLGLIDVLKRSMVELHNDEVTKSDPLAALSMGPRAMEIVLGERPGGGVKVTHFTTTPQIHLKDIPLAFTLKNLAQFEENLGRTISEYQMVSGITPSRTALSVLSVVLRKMNRSDREVCTEISSLCAEARAIDLTAPTAPEWSRSTPLKVAGFDVVLDVSLVKLSHAFRGLVGALKVDVPPEDRENKIGYSITLRLAAPTETEGLRVVKSFGRQVIAIPGLLAPLIGTEVALNVFAIPSAIASFFSNNSLLNSVVNNGVHMGCLVASGCIAFGIYMRLSALRAESGKD
jgi:hypothetical protein